MTARTSQTHPLEIDAVVPRVGGIIGMTLCPGKKQAGAASGDWDRDLETDLQVIRDWGAHAIVTLMEDQELERHQVADIGDRTNRLGMDWYHLPITVGRAPGRRFENGWMLYGLKVRRILGNGGKVLVHCGGGLGRTGTIAARLLVECGSDPRRAIRHVRKARRGAIESHEQEQHIRRCKRVYGTNGFPDRALGSLLGGAIGDVLGRTLGTGDADALREADGGHGEPDITYENGLVVASSATQMTLFSIEAIDRAGTNASNKTIVKKAREAYADWLETQGDQREGYELRGTLARRKTLRVRRTPDKVSVASIKSRMKGTPRKPINKSKGCGALTRVAPFGWIKPREPGTSFQLGARAGAITHGHPDILASAGILVALIRELFSGKPIETAVDLAISSAEYSLLADDVIGCARALDLVRQARLYGEKARSDPPAAITALGEGRAGDEALAIAIYSVLSASTFSEIISRAFRHDGGSAAATLIAGQIYGAWKGVDALPMGWIRKLDVLPECLHGVAALVRHDHRACLTDNRFDDPAVETALTILEMIHVLHRRGYQNLRLSPGMSPSGCYWRAQVFAKSDMVPGNGALARDYDGAARHTTGSGCYPFGWQDAAGKTADELANLFVSRFPELAERGRGSDWAYAGWYLELLGYAHRGLFPVAYADWYEEPPEGTLPLWGPCGPDDILCAPPVSNDDANGTGRNDEDATGFPRESRPGPT